MSKSSSSRITLPQFNGFVIFERRRRNDVLRRMARRAQDDVGVSVQLLDDLFRLEVPDVDQVVLGPRNNPLSTRHGKICKNAIFFIFVPAVRFEAFAFAVVPQLEGVVECGGEDVLSVGRKLDERDRRVVVVDQGLEALAGGGVPDAAESVVAAGDNQRTVAIEVNCADLKLF